MKLHTSWPINPLHRAFVLYTSGVLLLVAGCKTVPDPRASFVAQPRQIELGDTVYFTNKSTDYTDVIWDFGDGSTSSEINAHHNYTKPGDYLASLTVSRKDKSNTSILKITLIEPVVTVDVKEVTMHTFRVNWLTDAAVEWKLNDSLIALEPDQVVYLKRDKEMILALQVRGTNHTLWDTTIAANVQSLAVDNTPETLSEKPTDNPSDPPAVVTPPKPPKETPPVEIKPPATYVRKASITRSQILTGNEIGYSCESNADVEWDFNGEATSVTKTGKISFTTPGMKKITLKEKSNGREWKTFNVEVIAMVAAAEIARDLNKLANEGMTREAKKSLAEEMYGHCLKKSSTKVTGKENMLLKDFVTKVLIESSEYVKVETKVELLYDKTGKITEIQLIDLAKTEVE